MPFKNKIKNRDYQREYRRMKRTGECLTPCQTQLPRDFRIKTATDILKLLQQQILDVCSDTLAGRLEKARCVGYLSGIALKAIEAGNIAGRLEAVEKIMKKRN